MADKPTVLVLGGVGFIGRNLVHYLVTNDLTSRILVVDKALPQIAWLSKRHKESFTQVEFKQVNILNHVAMDEIFVENFDFIVNCAGETRPSQTNSVYYNGITQMKSYCARLAEANLAKKYIHLSTAFVYSPSDSPVSETSRIDPWTKMADHELKAEEAVQSAEGLEWVILRLPKVYGPGDLRGPVTLRLIAGGIYRYTGEKMKMLWSGKLSGSTVHVSDVCRAIWHVATGNQTRCIYNVVDKSLSSAETLAVLVSQLFSVKYQFLETLKSNIAVFSGAIEDVNDSHMASWSEICKISGIVNTPLTPYVPKRKEIAVSL